MNGSAAGTAILVIDMVGDMFGHEELIRQRGSLVEAINTLTHAGREAGLPIIWIREEHAPDLSDAPLEFRRKQIHIAITDTPGAELLLATKFDIRFAQSQVGHANAKMTLDVHNQLLDPQQARARSSLRRTPLTSARSTLYGTETEQDTAISAHLLAHLPKRSPARRSPALAGNR